MRIFGLRISELIWANGAAWDLSQANLAKRVTGLSTVRDKLRIHAGGGFRGICFVDR